MAPGGIGSVERLRGWGRLVRLALRQIGGRLYWILPLLPLLWPLFQVTLLLTGARQEGFAPAAAQNTLIGLPLAVLGLALGLRVIAGELDARTLEITYTVPGGARRVWLAKLAGNMFLLLAAEALLALLAWGLLTPFPPSALYNAMQAAVVYMALAMALSTLMRSEVAGGLLTAVVLVLNGIIFTFGGSRFSPFFNPARFERLDAEQLLAWTLQNRLGFILFVAALTALAFARAERREKMLAG